MLNSDNPLARHSGGVNFALGLPSSKLPTFSGGRNPARETYRAADKIAMWSHFRWNFLFDWIPAFAGMTKFCANGLFVFKPISIGMSIVLLCCAHLSFADSVTNKCTDGKQITYTDKPCEKLGLQDAGAINKDAVTIVPAITYPKVPQNLPRAEVFREKIQEDNDVYQCTTSNGLVSYSSTPCPKAGLLPQGFYAPIQQEVIRQSAACEKISANHDGSINSNITCP